MTGPEQVLLEVVVRPVRQAGIFGLREDELEVAFIGRKVTPNLKNIGMNSLSEMELRIGIENELRVSIIPAELEKLDSLNNLLNRIRGLKMQSN